MSETLTDAEVARMAGVTVPTLRRWVRDKIVRPDGGWTPAAAAQARIVGRLRARGHSLQSIRQAVHSGRLAYGFIEELFPTPEDTFTLAQAAKETGLTRGLIERIWSSMGFPATDEVTQEDLQYLRYAAAILDGGFPLVAFLQIVRVYGQALSQIADAEVRLFHLYVHEPLMRDGVPGLEIAEEMEAMVRELLPLTSPIMDFAHQRYLAHFLEQDVINHMETDPELGTLDLGRMRVAVLFADLAGYTRMTEELGDEEAVTVVERFIEAVESTLPDEARVVKTIGDEVMVVGSDVSALTEWAVGFQRLYDRRPQPRIGIHAGQTVYRDGDYYGREVNLAARVAARAAGGEVLVTRSVVDAGARVLNFERIGEVRLKGFSESTELFLASADED